MTTWIFPANPDDYNIEGAFQKLKMIDWGVGANSKVGIGDTVYIYKSVGEKNSEGKIVLKAEVLKDRVPEDEFIPDKEFQQRRSFSFNDYKRWVRLELTNDVFNHEISSWLSYENLKRNGLRSKMMGPMKLDNNPTLKEYIENTLRNNFDLNYMINQKLDRELADNEFEIKVVEYVLYFLKNNSFCNQIRSDWMQEWSSAGMAEKFCETYYHKTPPTTKIDFLFTNIIFNELLSVKNSDKNQFKKTLDIISYHDLACLESFYQLALKYGLESKNIKSNFRKSLAEIKDDNDRTLALFSLFSQGIFNSEAIILSQVYEDWYNEKYVFTKS